MENKITANSAVTASESLSVDDSPQADRSKEDAQRSSGNALAAFSGAELLQANEIDHTANDILSDPDQLMAILSASLDSL